MFKNHSSRFCQNKEQREEANSPLGQNNETFHFSNLEPVFSFSLVELMLFWWKNTNLYKFYNISFVPPVNSCHVHIIQNAGNYKRERAYCFLKIFSLKHNWVLYCFPRSDLLNWPTGSGEIHLVNFLCLQISHSRWGYWFFFFKQTVNTAFKRCQDLILVCSVKVKAQNRTRIKQITENYR